MVYKSTHRWSEEESIVAYLLSRSPLNRVYPSRKNGERIPHWSKPHYESIAEQLDLLFHENQPLRATNSHTVESHLVSYRVYAWELSTRIKSLQESRQEAA